MKRVILIGGSGFLGSKLMDELLRGHFELFAVVNKQLLPENKNLHLIEGGISALTTDLINEIKPEIIFHCARPVFPRFKKPGRHLAGWFAFRKNTQLLKNLSSSALKPLLVFASGSLVYGNSEIPLSENSELQPISYARQYFRGETPILKALLKNEYPVQIIRFPWLLGNGSWFAWFYLQSIKRHQAIPVFGEGNNIMEVIDVEDAAKLMLLISTTKQHTGIFNIPSNKTVTQQEFATTVSEVFSVKKENYKFLFPGALEKETLEAFNSNIQLTTFHKEFFEKFKYSPLKNSLEKIKKKGQKS